MSNTPDHGTDITRVWESLARDGGRIVYIVLDGAGGLRDLETGETALQAANTPNLDRIAQSSSCGMLELVGPGITPGSGPGHLALFGYDPLHYTPGRGILSARGIDFPLQEGDVAARANFATVAPDGTIIDRRAGRIATKTNERLCDKILASVKLDFDGQYFFKPVNEHRAVLVLRGPGLFDNVTDTDPLVTGVAPHAAEAVAPDSRRTAQLAAQFLEQARHILADEKNANALLLRGFQRYAPIQSLAQRFGLNSLCIARYPMYRGLSRLLGMDVAPQPASTAASFDTLATCYGDDHDFYFLHVKAPDSYGEDGDFEGKIAAIEEVDRHIAIVGDLGPEVLVVTSDHSTPAAMASHSWHPVPVMIASPFARADDVMRFDEYSCMHGALGLRPGVHLMGLALAHAGRLKKFGP